MRIAAFLFSATIASSAAAQELSGENCGLASPPPDAGEVFFATSKSTITGRVYPRLSAIARDYTGCQVLWAVINGRTSRSLVLLRDGHVVAAAPMGVEPFCELGERSAVTGCTPKKELVQVSYPPGCAARASESKSIPTDCTAAFEAEFKLHDQLPE